jgi:Arc/MetJ-type ribon-helix-helix transcriptional regulator
MERNQLNIRMSETLRKLIDAKRIELSGTMGNIPSRSDVLRYALEMYFGQDLSASEADRRKIPKQPTSDQGGMAD